MANWIEKMLNSMKLSDDEDDDFEDDDEITESIRDTKRETVISERTQPQAPKRFESRPLRSAQTQPSYKKEEEETYEQPRRVTTRPERTPVPMRSAAHGLEVSIMKPTTFDDSKEICDMLKDDRAIIINLEGIEPEQAQRMMDFMFGAIYSMDAKILQITGYVFCISPAKVEISGDYIHMISESTGFQIPNLIK